MYINLVVRVDVAGKIFDRLRRI